MFQADPEHWQTAEILIERINDASAQAAALADEFAICLSPSHQRITGKSGDRTGHATMALAAFKDAFEADTSCIVPDPIGFVVVERANGVLSCSVSCLGRTVGFTSVDAILPSMARAAAVATLRLPRPPTRLAAGDDGPRWRGTALCTGSDDNGERRRWSKAFDAHHPSAAALGALVDTAVIRAVLLPEGNVSLESIELVRPDNQHSVALIKQFHPGMRALLA